MQHERACEAGFTLIELLAVLVVLAIGLGLAVTFLGGRYAGDALQATAQEIASRCRAARMAAIRQASEQSVVIDMGNRVVTAGAHAPPLRIPETVSISSHTSAMEQSALRVAGIRFFPNGASTGGRIRLETGRQAYEVRVNWLTGRVAVERAL
jgi:general secretion pathway protein H